MIFNDQCYCFDACLNIEFRVEDRYISFVLSLYPLLYLYLGEKCSSIPADPVSSQPGGEGQTGGQRDQQAAACVQ